MVLENCARIGNDRATAGGNRSISSVSPPMQWPRLSSIPA